MKPRIWDAVALVVGVLVAIAAIYFDLEGTTRLSIALDFLCPASIVGFSLFGLLHPNSGWDFLLLLPFLPLINGLIYGLTSYLVRLARRGHRLATVPLVVCFGAYLMWSIPWSIENWPKPKPLITPVDLASPLAGRWDGMLHVPGFRDHPATLVCHPHRDGMLDGYLYIDEQDLGELELGTWARDSLHFRNGGFQYSGRRDSTKMAFALSSNGESQTMELQFVSPDTARLAPP